jgi:STE24 endopeptidase
MVVFSGLLGIPFSLYNTFVIEKRHGFSTIPFDLWLTDLMKGLVVSTILMVILLVSLLSLLYYAPKTWWFWVWADQTHKRLFYRSGENEADCSI